MNNHSSEHYSKKDDVKAGGARHQSAVDIGRAFGGALIFSLPMLMTMEMWWLGFYIKKFRLMLAIALAIPMLTLLSYHAGFRKTIRWKEDILNALVAYAVGFITAFAALFLMAIITFETPIDEIIGKVSLQAIPGSIGAMLARSLLGVGRAKQKERLEGTRYFGELFLMAVGALFLGLNVAPTEEISLISYKMSAWHTVAMAMTSLLIMHAFMYVVEFRGHEATPPDLPLWSVFLRFTVVGYAVVLSVSLYILWTFGRLEGLSLQMTIETAVVLSFPASLGAAAARLIL